MVMKCELLNKVYDILSQLDEPEVNSQIDKLANFIMSEVEGEPSQNQGAVDTAIRIIKSHQSQETLSLDWIDEHSNGASRSLYVWADDLKNLLVPKQELPVIPKFVADYIEECKRFNESGRKSLYTAMDSMPKEVSEWMTFGVESFGKGQELFARAWLDGFTVGEEQKYYVLDSEDIPLLEIVNDQTCKTTTGLSIYEDGRDNSGFELTEQEIKDYDDRYIPFMVPVDEVDNE